MIEVMAKGKAPHMQRISLEQTLLRSPFQKQRLLESPLDIVRTNMPGYRTATNRWLLEPPRVRISSPNASLSKQGIVPQGFGKRVVITMQPAELPKGLSKAPPLNLLPVLGMIFMISAMAYALKRMANQATVALTSKGRYRIRQPRPSLA